MGWSSKTTPFLTKKTMEWNGRKYRVAHTVKKEEFNLEEALKSLAEKKVQPPVWRPVLVSVREDVETPSVSPSQTPTNTPTPSITPSITPTNTVTPSVSPSVTPSITATITMTPSPSSSALASGTTEANTYLSAVVDAGGTGITSTVSAATVTLFTSLVSNNLYDKILAFYPLLGGNSSGCKFNAKNPIDTDGAYRLTFFGGLSFGVSGVTGNGTNSYAETHMSSTQESDLRVFGGYSLVLNSSGAMIGNGTSYLIPREIFGTRALFQFGGGPAVQIASSDSQGIYMGRRSSGVDSIWKNGVQINTDTFGSDSWGTDELYFCANNSSGSPADISSNTYGFMFMSELLNDTEMLNLSNIINTWSTTLSRNTY
jgi:hypothetical protein